MNSALKAKVVVPLLLGIAIAFSPILGAQDWDRGGRHDRDHHDRDRDRHESDNDTPLALIGVIGIPGNAISSTDIAWVDQATERLYFSDRGERPYRHVPVNNRG